MKLPVMTPMYVLLYIRMVEVARTLGYALAVHGTLARDLDVVAVPWADEAASAEELVQAIADCTAWARSGSGTPLGVSGPDVKPHGRRAWTIPFHGEHAIDLLVMPRGAQ